MRKLFVVIAAVAAALPVVLADPAAAAGPIADWQLKEPSGASTMIDASGNGLHGEIGDEVVTGVTFDGATGHRFLRLPPNQPPARPEHNTLVPHDPRLNPGSGEFAIEVRYRTTNGFGNLIQKGQATTTGGYFKIQLPQGEPSCLYRGPTRVTNAVRSRVAIDDGEWHTIRCEHTGTEARLRVDGVLVGRNRGTTGTIANTWPLAIGGKPACDQIRVTCDYFGGDIDYVRLFDEADPMSDEPPPPPPPGEAPVAAFEWVCDGLACSFDGSGSMDPEGLPLNFAWDFGDGSSGSGVGPLHTYTSEGVRTVTLTVTDGDGMTGAVSRQVTVSEEPPPPPPGEAPVAAFEWVCDGLACSFDGSGSMDPEGSPLNFAWDFGDGSSGSGVGPLHTYTSEGVRTVTLTVTDGDGMTGAVSRQVTVSEAPPTAEPVSFRVSSTANGNLVTPTIALPAAIEAGDLLLLNATAARVTPIGGLPGWDLVGERTSDDMVSRVWRRIATAEDSGSSVTVTFGERSKFALVVSAYAGVEPSAPVASVASEVETVFRAAHTTPAVPLGPAGSRLVSYWSDKSNDTSAWEPPSGQVERAASFGTGSGRISMITTDGAGGGGLTATASTASSKAIMWSITLTPMG